MKMKSICSVTLTTILLLVTLTVPAWASISADFTINGTDVNEMVDSSDSMTVKTGDILSFEYTGDNSACADIRWVIESQDGTEAIYGDSAYMQMENEGLHKITMVADGFTNIWSLCFRGNEYEARTVEVNVVPGNDYPIVLVHGFLGWGRDELNLGGAAMYYWGIRSGDLEEELNNRGYDVYTANVSKASSAWDRACELYTRLTGGTPLKADNCDGLVKLRPGYVTDDEGYLAVEDSNSETGKRRLYFVDYGNYHAQHATEKAVTNHYRFGNPRFGELVENTKGEKLVEYEFPENPINLVVHSYGGQTSRVMMDLLKDGSEHDEGDDNYQESELFKGGHSNFVRSLTTIAVPHNGTNLTFAMDDLLELSERFIGDVVKLVSNETFTDFVDDFYNVDMNQWEYLTYDMFNIEPIGCQDDTYLTDGKLRDDLRPQIDDFGQWDLSPCGSAEINSHFPADKFADETYYFTYNGEQTFKSDGNSLFGKKGWWYFEDYLTRTLVNSGTLELTWNISEGTNGGGDNVMSQPCMLWSDAMGSGTFTTGLAVTQKSLNMLATEQGETGYVPVEMITTVRNDLGGKSALELMALYWLNSQDFSDGWKFSDDPDTGETKEDKLRDKLYEIIPYDGDIYDWETYDMYISNIIEYGTFEMDLDETWREHDGVVNSKASIAPWGEYFVDGSLSSSDVAPSPTPNLAPETGKWLYLDILRGDHFDVIGGLDISLDDVDFNLFREEEQIAGPNTPTTGFFDFYEAHFSRLWLLPKF